MRKTYNLVNEPTGKEYKVLLLFALKYCDTFQFVVPHHIQKNAGVQSIIRVFKPFIINVTEGSEWPGTVLHRGTATIYLNKFNAETSSLLSELVDGLYSWVQPNFPEDLCIRRKDDTPWLTSISYENDAYFELTIQEKNELQSEIPNLYLAEQKENIRN